MEHVITKLQYGWHENAEPNEHLNEGNDEFVPCKDHGKDDLNYLISEHY